MYQLFYGFREAPFETTPDPRFLYMTEQHREALSSLQYGIQARKTLSVLLGEAGTGKTTLIRAILKKMEAVDAYVLCVSNPRLTRGEFIELLAAGFNLSRHATESKAGLIAEMQEALTAGVGQGRLTGLIVDEAQSLPPDLLEEVRLLANIETDTVKLLPVILAGQPGLANRLNEPASRQLKQRISLRVELRPLSLNETASYVRSRIRSVGGDCLRVFTRDAVMLIHERSAGIPRVINTLCDNALITGLALGVRPVTRAVVQEVCGEMHGPRGDAVWRGASA